MCIISAFYHSCGHLDGYAMQTPCNRYLDEGTCLLGPTYFSITLIADCPRCRRRRREYLEQRDESFL